MPYFEVAMSLKKWKKTLFTFLLALLGVIFLILTESVLRIFDVGKQYELIEEVTLNDKPYWRINRDFPSKYFRKIQDAPEFRDKLVPVNKNPNEKRILVLGESTAFGFPYSYNITFPDMLEYMMNTGNPDMGWKVINLSTSAINSYSVTDILKHASVLKPDALIIYMGHNEFYGAFGSASVEKGFTSCQLTHLLLKIRELRIYQVLESLLDDSDSRSKSSGPLMARVVRKKLIPYGSSLYLKTRLNFIKNLHRIHSLAADMNIPVFIGTLVSNERGLIPFASDFIDEELNQKSLHNEFMYYVETGDTLGASMWLDDLELWEPNTSILAYCKAQYYEWTGKPDRAAFYYIKARDLDVLRFRAGSDWNLAIRQFARESNWTCIPVDHAFEEYAAPYRPGNELFHEHVHPNETGYRLMAQTILTQLRESGFYTSNMTDEQIYESFNENYPITPFEQMAGELTIRSLTSRWPFQTENEPYVFDPSNTTEHYSWEYVNRKISWGKANQALVEYHINRHETDMAIRYTHSIKRVIPYHPYPYLRIARIYQAEEMFQQALDVLRSVDKILNDPEIWLLEGEIYYQQGEYDFALFALNESRISMKENPSLLPDDKKKHLYRLTVSALTAADCPEQAQRAAEEARSRYHLDISTPGLDRTTQ
jgi:lysophospholipase L1-like esterase